MRYCAYASICIWRWAVRLGARLFRLSNPAAGDVRMSKPGLDKWYAYMKSHDTSALWDLLHPDAVFESPVVHTPQRGRDITFKYLTSAAKVLGGPTFKYLGE